MMNYGDKKCPQNCQNIVKSEKITSSHLSKLNVEIEKVFQEPLEDLFKKAPHQKQLWPGQSREENGRKSIFC